MIFCVGFTLLAVISVVSHFYEWQLSSNRLYYWDTQANAYRVKH